MIRDNGENGYIHFNSKVLAEKNRIYAMQGKHGWLRARLASDKKEPLL